VSGHLRRRGFRETSVGCALVALSALGTACSSAPPSGVGSAAGSTGPSRVSLDENDSGRTVDVHVPATITVTLPYVPSSGKIWELESGGAGFAETGSPSYHAPSSAGETGTEVFSFKMTSISSIPIVIDEAKPGPLPAGAKHFSVTVNGS
jgi:hypothetical protein